MQSNITNLFVYGSLRMGFHLPAYEYISRYFTLISEAKVKGLLFYAGEYPAAVPTSAEVFITGELYGVKNVDDFSWAIEQLDAYEEVNSEKGEMPLYKRELTEVIHDNTTTPAWIYWYHRSVNGQIAIPSGDVMNSIGFKSKS